VFDFQVSGLTVTSGSTTVSLITNGCPDYSSLFAQPGTPTSGVLVMTFDLFVPKETSTDPSLPGTSATALSFAFTLNICSGSCTAVS
ncbi:hypothetical protein MAR_009889, partial [Mya arenaria]